MHIGKVHDDGPSAADDRKRVGTVYLFDHTGHGPPNGLNPATKNYLYSFDNGSLGENFDYLRGQMVNILVDSNDWPVLTNGFVTINGPADPSDSEYGYTEDGYANWRNEAASKMGGITNRPVLPVTTNPIS